MPRALWISCSAGHYAEISVGASFPRGTCPPEPAEPSVPGSGLPGLPPYGHDGSFGGMAATGQRQLPCHPPLAPGRQDISTNAKVVAQTLPKGIADLQPGGMVRMTVFQRMCLCAKGSTGWPKHDATATALSKGAHAGWGNYLYPIRRLISFNKGLSSKVDAGATLHLLSFGSTHSFANS